MKDEKVVPIADKEANVELKDLDNANVDIIGIEELRKSEESIWDWVDEIRYG